MVSKKQQKQTKVNLAFSILMVLLLIAAVGNISWYKGANDGYNQCYESTHDWYMSRLDNATTKAFMDAKDIYQPEYEVLSKEFVATHEYVSKDDASELNTTTYVCRHFAVDVGELLEEAGYDVVIESGYYDDGNAHAIAVVRIPISNGIVKNPEYLQKWRPYNSYSVEEYKFRLIRNFGDVFDDD